jgi:hypothetical protein
MKERNTFAGVPTTLGMPALTEKQMDVLRKTQDELIDEIQSVAVRWCARRHKMVEAMFDLSLTSLHNAGQIETAEACMRWYNGSLQRLSEDANDQMELAMTVAKCWGNGMFLRATSTESNGKQKQRLAA